MKDLPRLEHLSQLLVQSELSGIQGKNRYKGLNPLIIANNDYEAIQTWLREYEHKQTTVRAYRKEAERLLLWCILKAKKPLSSLNREDFDAYLTFLDDPQPREIWCKKKGGYGVKRGETNWRPFESGLSSSAKRTAMSILKSLMVYLHEARYLDSNPLILIRDIKCRQNNLAEQRIMIYERILEPDEWRALIETLEQWPEASKEEKNEKIRLKWLVALLFFLGLRVNDVCTNQWNAFKLIHNRWWFVVRGKGDKLAKLPVNKALLELMIDYRLHFGLSLYPNPEDNTPLIPSFRSPHQTIGSRQINQLIKRLAFKAAEKFPNSLSKQQKLKKISPHWFRHQFASVQARRGIAVEQIQKNMRHANYQTTLIYIHSDEESQHDTIYDINW